MTFASHHSSFNFKLMMSPASAAAGGAAADRWALCVPGTAAGQCRRRAALPLAL